MKTAELDYELPEELIAESPLAERDASRLLVVDRSTGTLQHSRVSELPSFCVAGDLLIRNTSKVLPARLVGRRATGGRVELVLVREEPAEGSWLAIGRPARRLRAGDLLTLDGGFEVEVRPTDDDSSGLVRIAAPGLASYAEKHGQTPLPPYIRRAPAPEDRTRYQTVYARQAGSSAAPTAGLHFTRRLLADLDRARVRTADVILHVGPGTFLPVRTADLAEHRMHVEEFEVPAATVEAARETRAEGRAILAIGTTTVRSLEAASDEDGLHPRRGTTDLLIQPGHQFRSVDRLLTNFHQPRSTLLALVGAFVGFELLWRAYDAAIEERYRFLSYGDAMLIL